MLAPADVIRLEDDAVVMLDQTRLPGERVDRRCTTVAELCAAIRELAIRGAPAIGIAAAMGMAQAARRSSASDIAGLRAELADASAQLAASRPTAVNLGLGARALRAGRSAERPARRTICARRSPRSRGASTTTRSPAAARWARTVRSCSRRARACSRTATRAASRPAATARRSASCARRTRAIPAIHVWVGETRPLLQGARLTAWELAEDGIPHTLIADVAAGQLFARGLVDAVVFGADRIARNGDAANKIGSYTLSVLAAAHGVPCYVVAPSSTIDHAIASGADIPIEERARRRGRAARRARGRAGGRAGRESRLRRHPGGQHHRDRHRAGVHRAPFERSLPAAAT